MNPGRRKRRIRRIQALLERLDYPAIQRVQAVLGREVQTPEQIQREAGDLLWQVELDRVPGFASWRQSCGFRAEVDAWGFYALRYVADYVECPERM